MFVCHQDDVCKNDIGRVYVGGYCGLSESGLLFGTLVGVSVFSAIWPELLMTSVIVVVVVCHDQVRCQIIQSP